MYPEPPTTDETLDIQQQALLREQKKKLNKMRKNAEGEQNILSKLRAQYQSTSLFCQPKTVTNIL